MKQFHFALGLLWILSIQMAFAFEVNGVYYTIDREAQNNEVMVTASPNSSYAGKIEIPNEIVRGGKTYMVTSIEMEAFANCQNLNEVVIPASVVSIGEMAFANSNIKTVTFEGGGITVIPYGCFLRCKNLREIQIPQSVESIKRAAFLDCSLLSRVEIPGSVTEIQGNAFSTNETPKNVNWGIMIEIKFGNKPLTLNTKMGGISFPCYHLSIDRDIRCTPYTAFGWKLESIKIGRNVRKLNDELLFEGCTEIKKIDVDSSNPPLITRNTFASVNKTECVLYVPKGATEKYATANYWSEFHNIIEK